MKSNKLKTRLYYGLGSVGVAIMDAFLGSFLTLYVTDVLKIDALLFSSILIGPKIFDIVIDIFIMYFVGKTKSKRGMYIPWLINMVPLAIALVLMFTTPYFAISTNWVIVVLVVTYFISSALCDSFYYIPYLAIPGVISEDNEEIVKLSSSKSIFENLSYTLVSIVTMPILLACGGHKNNDGWLIAAGVFAFLSILCTSFMFFGVKTNKELEKKYTSEYSVRDTIKDYKYILSNKKFLLTSTLFILIYLCSYITSTVSYYFYIYNMNMGNQISYLAILGSVVTVIVCVLTSLLLKKLGYKILFIIGASALIIYNILLMLCNITALVYIAVIFRVLGCVIILNILYTCWTNLSKEMSDNNNDINNTKKIKAPLNNVMGLSNMVGNIAGILGSLIGSAILSLSKYDGNIEVQSSYTLDIIRFVAPIICIVIMILFIIFTFVTFKRKKIDE